MTKLSVGARKRALVSVAVEERNTHSINWAIQVRALALEIGCWELMHGLTGIRAVAG
jgi:hypothetical protein